MTRLRKMVELIYNIFKIFLENMNYTVDDYNNPANYNLYYQSLYQMYPQMSDVIYSLI
jgi:hypothetical protein